MQNSKVRLITPFLMLFAGALASIIMFIRDYELYTMLWVLLIVLIVFYIIGDVACYLYRSVQPRVLPQAEIEEMIAVMNNNVVEKETAEEVVEEANKETATEEVSEEETSEYDMNDEYSMDEESVEEYTDENLDEM